jgi:hypothetical protein
MGKPTPIARMQMFAAVLVVAAAYSVGIEASAGVPSVPPDGQLKFRVFMSGRDIGHKTIRFTENGDTLQVDTELDFRVRFAFLTVYVYEHRNREIWRNGLLQSLDASTNDDGDKTEVKVRLDGDELEMTSGRRVLRLPRDTFPSNYWNKGLLRAKVAINNQLGEGIALESRAIGNDTVVARGKPVAAQRHKLIGYDIRYGDRMPRPYLDVDLWYDEADVLVHMSFQYRGFEFVYVLE